MEEEILRILEQNARETPEAIAQMLGADCEKVREKIAELEEKRVIAAYKAVINWDRIDNDLVTALIDLKITPQLGKGFDRVAEKIYQFPHVKSVYLMSGGYDLSVTIEGKSMKDVALFVAEKLAPMECVLSTTTHFILRKYKDGGIILNQGNVDGRQMITL